VAWGGGHHSDGPASSSSSSSSSSSGGNVGSQGRGPGMGNDPGREGSTVGSGTNQAERSSNQQRSPNHPSQSYDPNKTNPVVGDPDKAKLSKDLVEKLAPDTLKALIAGGHGVSGSTYGGLSDDAKDRVDDAVFGLGEDEAAAALDAHQRVMAYVTQQAIPVPPHIDRLTPQVAAALTMNQLSPQQQSAFISKYGSLENMGYVPGQGLMNLTQQPTVRDITTGEILGYPSEGLTGYLGMAADFLGLDTSGVNFGVDPEAEREATRGRELTPADPLYYQTLADEATGMPQTVSLEEDITGVMDYAPVYYGVDNWPGAISYAKNGGLASLVPKRRKV
jgi:hypothetical protein